MNEVRIYTARFCPYCASAKSLLKRVLSRNRNGLRQPNDGSCYGHNRDQQTN